MQARSLVNALIAGLFTAAMLFSPGCGEEKTVIETVPVETEDTTQQTEETEENLMIKIADSRSGVYDKFLTIYDDKDVLGAFKEMHTAAG